MTSLQALASSATPEHYTPSKYIAAADLTMGGIDLDPASCAEAQERVQASRFYTFEDDGLNLPWAGRVFCNPPGDPRGQLPQMFWERMALHIDAGTVTQFVWVAFNISHLRTMQNGALWLLEHCDVFIPESRIKFTGGSPTKDNAILYWGNRGWAFRRHFAPIGGAFWKGNR